MPDMLVKLYELEDDWQFLAAQKQLGIVIRKPIGPEKQRVVQWVADNFGAAWAAEADCALAGLPHTCFVAVKDTDIAGFACYDATALGFFGPIGVDQSDRNQGTGKALLCALPSAERNQLMDQIRSQDESAWPETKKRID